MQNYQAIQLALAILWAMFVFAFGCICGSFINVLVYRLPKRLGIVTPPSACPACGTRLTWKENFPVLGWVWLGGKCRFCKTPISIEYPVVELLVGLLFVGMFSAWLMEPSWLSLITSSPEFWRPDWTNLGGRYAWPTLLIHFALVGSLVAITLIDVRTFTIPLAIPWFMAIFGIVAHVGHAVWLMLVAPSAVRSLPHSWTIPVTDGGMTFAAIGGVLGLAISIALVEFRILPRSFSDYEEWEQGAEATRAKEAEAAPHGTAAPGPDSFKSMFGRTLALTGPAIALMFVGAAIGIRFGQFRTGMIAGMTVGLVIGAILRHILSSTTAHIEPIWVQYPHARREMLKELTFLLPAILLFFLALRFASSVSWDQPLWLRVLGGTLLGYLAGGAVVWGVRILGSLLLGKEAMGLGDVHLMAGVGALIGWIDPVIAFFVAPFLGISWALGSTVWGQFLKRHGTALPYGPHLAAATIMVVALKPLFESILTAISGQRVDLP